MGYIKVKDKSLVEPVIKGEKILKAVMYKNVFIQGDYIDTTINDSNIVFSALDQAALYNYVITSMSFTVASFNRDNRTLTLTNFNIQGYSTGECEYIYLMSGNSNHYIGPAYEYGYDGTVGGYRAYFSINGPLTFNYTQTQWNEFATDNYSQGHYEMIEHTLWEEANNYEWTYYGRIGDTVQRNPNVDLIGASSSDIYDKWQPTQSFLNKYAYIYLGYDYRGYYGAPGDPTSIAHIYEYYKCEISAPIVPTYSWVERGEYMFSIRDANRYDINNDATGKQYSVAYLNANYPPGIANERKLAGDYLRQEYIQVSPGVYQYMHFYDVYECARIS